MDQEWCRDDLCCALSVNDGQWYRAKILEVGSEANVFYVDYGNTETLPLASLRKIDQLFSTQHAFALKVTFHIKWNVPLANLLELAGETEYNGVVLRKNSAWVAELVDSSGENLSEKLVELKFAIPLGNSPFKRIVEGGRFVKGTEISVTVHCVDSPLQLWVNVVDDIELVDALQDRLQEAAPKLPLLKEPMGIFAVKYSDGQWYRAVKVGDRTVKFIDYGNTYIIDMANIKTLSPDFLEPTDGYAIKIELPVVDFKEEATKRLSDLLYSEVIDSEEEITVHILSVKEASIEADIFKGGKSVVDILVEESLGKRVYKAFSCFISHINNLNDFFVQEVGCEEPLEDMANIMLMTENFKPITEISLGDMVAALYPDDGLWYRANITKITEAGTEVLFIDYGNSAVVMDLKMLPDDLLKKPALSTRCALLLPQDVQEWSVEANNKFTEMSADGCTQFQVKILNQECPASVVLFYDKFLVADQLKSLCQDKTCVETSIQGDHINISPEGYNVTAYISHFNNPNDFYVQPEDFEDELEMMRAALEDTSSFKEIENLIEEVSTHRIVGALFNDDGLWYRAKLLNCVENGAHVLFVDYGNTAIATDFKELPENIESKPLLAIHCSISKQNWSEAASQFFTELSGEGSNSFKMKVVEDNTEPKIVSLITGGKLVEDQLVSLFGEPSFQSEDITEMKLSSDPAIQSVEVNSTENVFLIQVFSPSDFYLHTAEATQLIGKISERLIVAENFPTVEGPSSQGDIVAAQFDEDDLWYRVKVLDLLEDVTKVLFIDYGNTAKVAKMKTLPEDLVSIPPLAMHCCLQKVSEQDEWSTQACEKFNSLANDDEVTFNMKVIQKGEPDLVDLFINGKSVSELLSRCGMVLEKSNEFSDGGISAAEQTDNGATSTTKEYINSLESSADTSIATEKTQNHSLLSEVAPPSNSSDADIRAVKLSHFNTCYDFYLQWDSSELNQITNAMNDAESFETMLDDNKILAAKNEDGGWSRAKVVDLKSEESTVLFIDFGHTGLSKCFRKLPKHLAEVKPQALNCCLSVPKDYAAIANDTMTKLAKVDPFQIDEVVILEEKEPCVVDLIVCGQSLTDIIVKAKTADDIVSEIVDCINEPKTDFTYMQQITEELVTNASQINDCSVDLAASTLVVNESSIDSPNVSHLEETSCNMVTDTILVNESFSDLEAKQVKECHGHLVEDDSLVAELTDNLNNEDCDLTHLSSGNMVLKEKQTAVSFENPVNNGDAKLSPSTPRRSNIDEHIVPGCVSTTKIEETAEHS